MLRPRHDAVMDLPPIPISKQSLAEFKAIWCAKHGETLTDDQAAYIGVAKTGPYKPDTYRY